MSIVQLVPMLPPAIDGLGDYALNLARQFCQEFGLETQFIVGNPTWEGAREMEGFPISVLSENSRNAVLSSLLNVCPSVTTVLLHYVGYGYAKRGCPAWLVEGLQQWRTTGANRFLVTMFHELYAIGPPWTSSFWLSPLQKNLVMRLAKLSDRCLTSHERYADDLVKLSHGKHTQILTLPVFSNLGEPKQVPTLAERQRQLVVFGTPSNRLRVYQNALAELELTCHLLSIEKILDIGLSTSLSLSTVNGVPVVKMGKLAADEISALLLDSCAGFFNYNPDCLAKSTIFAAYCAHGILPVSPRSSIFSVDGVIAGTHYWIPDSQQKRLNLLKKLQVIADSAYAWYHTHNLSVQTRILFTHLNSLSN
ncbi:MAG TPA: glycosyltransferase family 1 protein [Coleofasciculaceae cyanobacterium]